jgi:hypothetical protein
MHMHVPIAAPATCSFFSLSILLLVDNTFNQIVLLLDFGLIIHFQEVVGEVVSVCVFGT